MLIDYKFTESILSESISWNLSFAEQDHHGRRCLSIVLDMLELPVAVVSTWLSFLVDGLIVSEPTLLLE